MPAAEVPGFADLGVAAEIVSALSDVGITAPFPIQALTLPIALSGADLIGQARTGTGKTLAFGIPLLQRIDLPGGGKPQALVVVPTRELCVQVTKDIATAGASNSVRTLSIYGGRSYEPQVEALRKGIDVVVGTPGRLLDLAKQGHLDLSEVRALVLDEADEMLDLGFLPDVERILALVNTERQTMLFSATMPGPIVTLARRFMSRPTHITAEQPDENRTVPTTAQHIFRAHSMDKGEMLARILQADGRGLTMVFCRTKRTCDKVALDMVDRGFAAAAVHGDLGQGQREQALRAFRAGKIDVLVATDVAARGIDVAGVTHVVNYQCPEDEKTYLHRIGRTGRAGGSGIAVTFVDWDDLPRWSLINTALELPFPDPPETYSNSASLYAALDIPRSATGRLPRVQRTRLGLAAEAVEDLGETGRARRPRSSAPAQAPAGRNAGRAGRGG
ncbi:MAG: DEAD/DEAH box helicase, partial [Actinomycetota bacterium]|nr:DEAD/DEAH box helicase [Actinomycetota bacterium]